MNKQNNVVVGPWSGGQREQLTLTLLGVGKRWGSCVNFTEGVRQVFKDEWTFASSVRGRGRASGWGRGGAGERSSLLLKVNK